MAAQGGETFAGLVQAVVDSGLDPCVFEILESHGVRAPLQAKAFLAAGVAEPELSSILQAVVITACGPQMIAAVRDTWVASEVSRAGTQTMKRKDLPTPQISSAGSSPILF